MPHKPTSKQTLTSLLNTLTHIQSQLHSHPHPTTNPLHQLTPADQTTTKQVLLTLHFLFPHELLPALDLIDRNLLTQLSTSSDTEIYYVQSSSSSTSSNSNSNNKSRFRDALARPGEFYECRLDAWNCSCPAFAFSAMKLLLGSEMAEEGGEEEEAAKGSEEWLVGGTMTREGAVVPVCKHLLAVVLVRAAPGVLGHGVTRREVSREELAGWAAGWGEH